MKMRTDGASREGALMERLGRSSGTGLWILLMAMACGGNAGEGVQLGGETNWLATCSTDSDCSVGSCLCNVCTISCAENAACSDGPPDSSCVAQSELPLSCGEQLGAGLCLSSEGAATEPSRLDQLLELFA